MKKNNILVVDDEESLCEILQFNLEIEGYNVDVAYSAEQAFQMNLEKYSLIILDIMMGPMSGLKMAQIVKNNEQTANIPIIFCTAKESEDDTVTGLNIGADDYIVKPFSIREVVARVKSVLRRTEAQNQTSEDKEIRYETLCIDVEKKCCTLDDNDIKLTKKELEILTLFLKNIGKIFSREEILKRVWDDQVIVLDRTIDVNITRLRKKTGQYGKFIITRIGYGYGFKD
ncbi:MAG: response regulator transcription factor [Prevotellaceae bacterium]|jgi:two-component system phosphate regulon response regulator PhoB|nr:response regulator transcription factor [Prevotellaceae bacterium]